MTTENDDIIEVDNPTADQYLEGKNPNLIAIYHRLFDVIIDKIPNVYANSISSLAYIAWKTNDIKKSSFADINIQRNRIVIWTEPPTADHTFTVGEQIPNDKHHNHYFKIIYDEEQLDQIISIIVDSYNQLKTQ